VPKDVITIDEAQAAVTSAAAALGPLGTELVAVADALDRVLAAGVQALAAVPPFACSAMDGYALGPGSTPGVFAVVGESRAGIPHAGPRLGSDQAVRISTGAAVPAGAVAVVRQEDTISPPSGGTVEVRVEVRAGDNVRNAGEDMRAGDPVLAAGTWIGPAEIGAAVAAGASDLTVARRPVVSILCTGDELREPGATLAPGEIHNSNEPMLGALARRAGALLGPGGRVPDDAAATEAALGQALAQCDLLVVSGGVSVGPHDHVRPALERLGVACHFWGVALQPGRPTWFGSDGSRLVLALPGNPVSVAVTFGLFAAPAIDALLGATPRTPLLNRARLAVDVRRNGARDQAIRVTLDLRESGMVATPTGAQGSHLLTSLVRADSLALIPRGDGALPAGTPVALIPLPGR
jgi:molybdopterin molybdotransferase